MIRLLLFSPRLSQVGGVVDFVGMLRKNLSGNILCHMFYIGRRSGNAIGIGRLFLAPYDGLRLIFFLISRKFDVVHINPSLKYSSLIRDGFFLVLLRLARVRNVVVFFHGWDSSVERKIQDDSVYRWLFRKTFGWPPVIYVLANRFRQSLVEFGITDSEIHTITTMFDGGQFEGISRQREDKNVRVLFMARLVKEKGIYELVDAIGRLSKELVDIELVMAGDGPERESVQSYVQEKQLTNRVLLPGFMRGEEKYQMLVDSDIFILPSYYGEGCPVALLEAMAAGLAIVTTPAGGIGDFFINGENGVLLNEVSPQSLEAAITTLVLNFDLRSRMGLHNRDVAWKCYEAHMVSGAIESEYNALSRSCS